MLGDTTTKTGELASVALRRIVQTELMRSILPSGLPSNYQGPPPMLPAVGVNMEPFLPSQTSKPVRLRENPGATLLVVRQYACEGRTS